MESKNWEVIINRVLVDVYLLFTIFEYLVGLCASKNSLGHIPGDSSSLVHGSDILSPDDIKFNIGIDAENIKEIYLSDLKISYSWLSQKGFYPEGNLWKY